MLTQEDISRIAGDAIEWAKNKDEMDEDCKTCFMFGIQFLRDWLIREDNKNAEYGKPYAETTIPLSQLEQVQILDEKNWLYLPEEKCYISVKDIRSIGLKSLETYHEPKQAPYKNAEVTVIWNSGSFSDYHGIDGAAIWDWAEKGRINPE